MYKTKIDLSEKIRRNVIAILNDRLADAIDLQSQVKQAHWNVKGPHFIACTSCSTRSPICRVGTNRRNRRARHEPGRHGRGHGGGGRQAQQIEELSAESITAGKDHLFYLSTQLSVYGKAVRAAIEDTTNWAMPTPRTCSREFPRPRQVPVVPRGASAGEGLMGDP
jgi:starvation-inducible DNA-binding protein